MRLVSLAGYVAGFHLQAFADGYRQEGAALFAKGMRARLLYFAPSAAIAMTSYEVVKWVLSATHFAALFRTKNPSTPGAHHHCH